ncbi:hypothetical protein BURPS1710A_A2585 [Burkholderia pseudomallei 1710a]|uniref:Uncharacterized protein n=1 Tax=Burkholderia pseudomallei 1710a TaxID=320371 RepID=A0A0E1VVC9_BURPE|nr:hypothetical protein BURPS1710A_A2585 [Burkholderia pseudomallei 1710a]
MTRMQTTHNIETVNNRCNMERPLNIMMIIGICLFRCVK